MNKVLTKVQIAPLVPSEGNAAYRVGHTATRQQESQDLCPPEVPLRVGQGSLRSNLKGVCARPRPLRLGYHRIEKTREDTPTAAYGNAAIAFARGVVSL